jgi:hypothetical protein
MRLSDQHLLPLPMREAWTALNDLDLLREALPGCESLEQTAAGEYAATLALGLGLLAARVEARLRRRELAPSAQDPSARRFVLQFDADGSGSRGKGRVDVCLRPAGRRATALHYELDIEVAGAAARLGAAFIDAVAGRIAQAFFERLRDRIAARTAVA